MGASFLPLKTNHRHHIMKINLSEKNLITVELIGYPILTGNDRSHNKGYAINKITEALNKAGYDLNMVSGDTILGEKGNLNIGFSKSGTEEMVDNACIHFVWENLSGDQFNPRWEFLAYVS